MKQFAEEFKTVAHSLPIDELPRGLCDASVVGVGPQVFVENTN